MQTLRFSRFSWGGVLFFLSAPIIFLTIIGFLGRFWWIFELACHFRAQYFVLLALFATLFTLEKKWKPAVFTAVFALVNLALIVPYGATVKVAQANQYNLRSLSMNLDFRNPSYGKAAALIKETRPDFLILMELTQKWESELKGTLDSFPYSARFRYITPSRPNWLFQQVLGLAPNSAYSKQSPLQNLSIRLFSHLPFESTANEQLNSHLVPHVKADFEFKGIPFTLLATHLYSPASKSRSSIRNRQLITLASMVRELNQPTVLLGDLNTTPWSPYFKDFIQMTGLLESRKGLGLYPTWPTWFSPLRIPIDHSLTSNGITVQSFGLGRDIGSDHFPIILDFSVG